MKVLVTDSWESPFNQYGYTIPELNIPGLGREVISTGYGEREVHTVDITTEKLPELVSLFSKYDYHTILDVREGWLVVVLHNGYIS